MRITVNKTIVTWKLGKELVAAGIQNNGMSLFGDELEILLANEEQASLVPALIAAHDGIDTMVNLVNDARTAAANIPNWATWTQTELQTWYDANLGNGNVDNITNLADAKVFMKKQNAAILRLAQMVIALRDYTRLIPPD
jgi:hypothetical protein